MVAGNPDLFHRGPDVAQVRHERRGVPGPDGLVVASHGEQGARHVAPDEVDRLRVVLALRRAGEGRTEELGVEYEIVGTGETDVAGEYPGGESLPAEVPLVVRDKRSDLCAGAVAHQKETGGVAAPLADPCARMCDRSGDVLDERRKRRRGHQSVVRQHGQEPLLGEPLPHPAVRLLVAALPTAAMHEDDHRQRARQRQTVRAEGSVHIVALPLPGTIRDLAARCVAVLDDVGGAEQDAGATRYAEDERGDGERGAERGGEGPRTDWTSAQGTTATRAFRYRSYHPTSVSWKCVNSRSVVMGIPWPPSA